MSDIAILVWGLAVVITVSALMHYCLQAVDFSKIFKADSTFQIKVIMLFISLSCGIICAVGTCLFLDSLSSL